MLNKSHTFVENHKNDGFGGIIVYSNQSHERLKSFETGDQGIVVRVEGAKQVSLSSDAARDLGLWLLERSGTYDTRETKHKNKIKETL